MPRRKAADRDEPARKRTRSGCRQCRQRRVKCDEARPDCSKCASRGIRCEYNYIQLKWQSEYHSSGRAFGREGVWSKSTGSTQHRGRCSLTVTVPRDGDRYHHPISKHHFVHTYYHDIGQLSALDGLYLVPRNSIPTTPKPTTSSIIVARPPTASLPASTIPRSVSPYRAADGFDPCLLEYYFRRICPLANPLRHCTSPFVELVMPLVGSGQHTLASLSAMAFSARHRSLTLDGWSSAALHLKGQALSALRSSLGMADDAMISRALQNSDIPIAMMFLCLYEIIESCDDRWVIHLRACQDFLHRRKQLAPLLDVETPQQRSQVSLAERFFAFQDAISRTACGNSSVFSLEYWQSTDRHADGPDQGWMGCSTRLARLLFRMTELGRMRGDMSTREFEADVEELECELVLLDDAGPIGRLLVDSAKLYLHCLLHDATPASPLVVGHVRRILQLLYDLVQETECISSGLAFPLFIAAAELDPLNDEPCFYDKAGNGLSGRRLVLEIVQTVSGSCLFNVERIGNVIRQIWANRDLHPVPGNTPADSTAMRGPTAQQNDWHICVSPYCTNLSLA
ncbi:Fungal Zn(2)-Cys(6) binuclear cluster domain [Geosmithia morbida]|uniref:Fungal Zn(2)-Cys(6) binuclear cluster domain n=1 Tax=Geosmithia morbida TaxID=1094350 RepID=A0A9P4YPH9_9HYPO|nr:Fungal Zn(2)-Cys(6) binuclear cluster domain [Geosmithia morbida]KAF4119665.1 Fungal Zn(2)-Cys(6) binuclear cluster domain [Geosmithia morbida]